MVYRYHRVRTTMLMMENVRNNPHQLMQGGPAKVLQ